MSVQNNPEQRSASGREDAPPTPGTLAMFAGFVTEIGEDSIWLELHPSVEHPVSSASPDALNAELPRHKWPSAVTPKLGLIFFMDVGDFGVKFRFPRTQMVERIPKEEWDAFFDGASLRVHAQEDPQPVLNPKTDPEPTP